MKLSSKTHYGLRACHILAQNYSVAPVSASELEKGISVSGKYLERIMRMLSARGIVTATRGVQGGYSLAKPPKEITVGEIVRTLEDDMEIIKCVNTDVHCKCASAKVFKKLYNGINEVFDGINLQQMVDGDI